LILKTLQTLKRFLRGLNLDHSIVGYPDPKQIFYLRIDDKGSVNMERTMPFLKNPNVFNRNFFGKESIPSAIFIYAGKDELNERWLNDYIVIDSVHPDYILGPEEGYMNKVSPEVSEMARKGDFSFVRRLLFKKVGMANGKVLYMENPTKTKGINFLAMYKPVNHWGNDNFNEIRNVNRTSEGEYIGEPSILRDKTKIIERSDVELMSIIDSSQSLISIKVADDPTNFKNEFRLGIENQNNSVSLPESPIDQNEINNILDQFEGESDNC
jgi:hypothetical protein